jgi:hypothetical protein
MSQLQHGQTNASFIFVSSPSLRRLSMLRSVRVFAQDCASVHFATLRQPHLVQSFLLPSKHFSHATVVSHLLTTSSPPRPYARPTRIHRPLRNLALRLDTLNNLLPARLNHNTTHNHLAQHRMQRLEIENQVQLAYILKQVIQTLDKDVDQVQQRQRAFR